MLTRNIVILRPISQASSKLTWRRWGRNVPTVPKTASAPDRQRKWNRCRTGNYGCDHQAMDCSDICARFKSHRRLELQVLVLRHQLTFYAAVSFGFTALSGHTRCPPPRSSARTRSSADIAWDFAPGEPTQNYIRRMRKENVLWRKLILGFSIAQSSASPDLLTVPTGLETLYGSRYGRLEMAQALLACT
jgi:hypothetical protein